MITKILIGLGLAVLAFELAEHVVIPLIWLAFGRKRRPGRVLDRLVGQEAEVSRWRRNRGQVFIRGELWEAVSGDRLQPGDKAVVQKAEGLTLTVSAAGTSRPGSGRPA